MWQCPSGSANADSVAEGGIGIGGAGEAIMCACACARAVALLLRLCEIDNPMSFDSAPFEHWLHHVTMGLILRQARQS